jgi:hypothetical protein
MIQVCIVLKGRTWNRRSADLLSTQKVCSPEASREQVGVWPTPRQQTGSQADPPLPAPDGQNARLKR